MKTILLGHDEADIPMHLDLALRKVTHTHVVGGSGTGKSRFLEHRNARPIMAS